MALSAGLEGLFHPRAPYPQSSLRSVDSREPALSEVEGRLSPRESLSIYFVITPQAMRSPELPEGSVL